MLRRQLTIVITDGDSSQLWSLHTLDVDQPSNRPPPSLRPKSYFYPRLPSVNMTFVAQMSTDFLLSVILFIKSMLEYRAMLLWCDSLCRVFIKYCVFSKEFKIYSRLWVWAGISAAFSQP